MSNWSTVATRVSVEWSDKIKEEAARIGLTPANYLRRILASATNWDLSREPVAAEKVTKYARMLALEADIRASGQIALADRLAAMITPPRRNGKP